jgi:hypothetical protein
VVTAVAPAGIDRRDAGGVGFTTSLGFPRKLERIIRDPHVALAFHTREHGFSASPAFVLAQGRARVDITPSRQRLEALIPQAERYFGKVMRGPMWDRLLREYYFERVFVDIAVERMVAWPDLGAAGEMEVTGGPWPGAAAPQQPPKNGTGPRVDVDRAAGRIAMLPHRVLAYRAPTSSRSWSPWRSPGMMPRACGWWYLAGCSRREAAAQACWPMRTDRS